MQGLRSIDLCQNQLFVNEILGVISGSTIQIVGTLRVIAKGLIYR